MEQENQNREWYALRVTYRREMVVKRYLDDRHITNYIPMHTIDRIVNGRNHRQTGPAIHNLIFVNIEPNHLREIKSYTMLPICYIIDPATKAPVVIPREQMENFMAVIETMGEQAEVVALKSCDLHKNEIVKVVDGPFKGVIGRCIQSKGGTKVLVEIEQIAATYTAYIPLKFIEKIAQ